MALRFRDTGQTIYEFAHEFLVHCPQCDKCARVVPKNNEDTNYFAPRRLICTECGYVKYWAEKSIRWVSETDWYFCLPLWLQTPCCRKTLWAYNKEHLDFLESFVRATLRENYPLKTLKDRPSTWKNSTLASSLPTWMKRAQNREEVLRSIDKLRTMLE